MRKAYWIVAIITLATACLCFSADQAPAPEPPRVFVTAPDPTLPAEIKSLVGKWVGRWNSRWGWDMMMYVEKVDKESAQVVFSWGEYSTSAYHCHCNPNWVRVQKANITYSEQGATLEFHTPVLRPRWLRQTHTVSGSSDEALHGGRPGSTGIYSYSFVLEKNNPDSLRGHFISGQASQLRAEMKKVEQDKNTER